MGLHLLISVFVTPSGLNRYRLGYIYPNSDEIFRISRFLSSCLTLTRVKWDSVVAYIELDAPWRPYEGMVSQAVTAMFPEITVMNQRLETRSQWALAADRYNASDVILLQTNDDHALVADDDSVISGISNKMRGKNAPPMAFITHFSEAQAMTFRPSALVADLGDGDVAINQSEAIGTTLVRGDFFRSWWLPGRISDFEKIVRPDNPFGKSVEFVPTPTIIPRVEVMRHMDGYSHIGLFKPLPPLRNLIAFVPGESSEERERGSTFIVDTEQPLRFVTSYWPNRLFAYSGAGADVHRVSPVSFGFLANYRSDIAQLQASWGLRIGWTSARRLLDPARDLPGPYVAAVSLIAMTTPAVARNLPDALIDLVTLPVKLASRRLNPQDPWPGRRIEYAGWARVAAADWKNLGLRRFASWEIFQRPVAAFGRLFRKTLGNKPNESHRPNQGDDNA